MKVLRSILLPSGLGAFRAPLLSATAIFGAVCPGFGCSGGKPVPYTIRVFELRPSERPMAEFPWTPEGGTDPPPSSSATAPAGAAPVYRIEFSSGAEKRFTFRVVSAGREYFLEPLGRLAAGKDGEALEEALTLARRYVASR